MDTLLFIMKDSVIFYDYLSQYYGCEFVKHVWIKKSDFLFNILLKVTKYDRRPFNSNWKRNAF